MLNMTTWVAKPVPGQVGLDASWPCAWTPTAPTRVQDTQDDPHRIWGLLAPAFIVYSSSGWRAYTQGLELHSVATGARNENSTPGVVNADVRNADVQQGQLSQSYTTPISPSSSRHAHLVWAMSEENW